MQIPGHHFPPIIIGSLIFYLVCISIYSDVFSDKTVDTPPQTASNGSVNKDEPYLNGERSKATTVEKEIESQPIFNKDEKMFLRTVFLGIPNWKDEGYSYLTIAFNILLALFTLDLVFRGPLIHTSTDLRFSRVGHVDSNSAKVLLREPDPHQLPLYVFVAPKDSQNWITIDRIFYLDSDTDYTYAVTITRLKPSVAYTYSLSNNQSGTFTTAAAPGSAASNQLTFLTSSCIKANFPYSPLSHSLATPGFTHLSTIYQSLPSPAAFMLFLGDFIYIDVPLRLSSSISHYRSEYRRVYASPSWSLPGISSVPWLHTLDDHEIANDWSSGNNTEPFPAASDPFIHYHVSVNPPTPPSTRSFPDTENVTYFQFTNGPASFFMLDTRRYRTAPEPTSAITNSTMVHTMLGPAQLHSLLTYLSTPEPPHVHWKFIASSVPFTKK
jgi:alkaline phosphatase D